MKDRRRSKNPPFLDKAFFSVKDGKMISYVIDGYNVLFAMQEGQIPNLERARETLRLNILRLALISNRQMALVWDGKRGPAHFLSAPSRKTEGGLVELYTGGNRDADIEIMDMMDRHPQPRILTVVTSDREISSYAKECGVQMMKSPPFIAWMTDTLNNADSRPESADEEKPKQVSHEDVNFWLNYFGESPE